MINKDYTIYINKRPFKISLKMLMCHCTGKIQGLLPSDEYSLFLRDYYSPVGTLVPYLKTYLSYTTEEEYPYVSQKYINCSSCIPPMRNSLLLACWYGTYFNTISTERKRSIYINELVDAGVNYPRIKLSDAYLSLQPLTNFYKRLTIDLDMERYMPLYEKDYVTIDNIKDTLKDLNTDVTYEDIKDDLVNHCILNPYKDYYIWGSKPLYEWFLNVDYIDFKLINLNKVFGLL